MANKDRPRRERRRPRGKRSPETADTERVIARKATPHGVCEYLATYDTAGTRFGQVRRCRFRFRHNDGRIWDSWTWDPTWQPAQIPDGAVRGDISRQGLGAFSGPRYWYEDRRLRCVQCRSDFVFSGSEQKYWYETLGFYCDSVAIRCVGCRRKARTGRVLREGLATALRATEKHPDQGHAWLDLAWATEQLRAALGAGDVDRGIAAARKARALGVRAEVDLVEAKLQVLAGRPDKARALLRAALDEPCVRRVRRKVEALLGELEKG